MRLNMCSWGLSQGFPRISQGIPRFPQGIPRIPQGIPGIPQGIPWLCRIILLRLPMNMFLKRIFFCFWHDNTKRHKIDHDYFPIYSYSGMNDKNDKLMQYRHLISAVGLQWCYLHQVDMFCIFNCSKGNTNTQLIHYWPIILFIFYNRNSLETRYLISETYTFNFVCKLM